MGQAASTHRQTNDGREGDRGSPDSDPSQYTVSTHRALSRSVLPFPALSLGSPVAREASSGLGWAGLPESSRWLASTSVAMLSRACPRPPPGLAFPAEAGTLPFLPVAEVAGLGLSGCQHPDRGPGDPFRPHHRCPALSRCFPCMLTTHPQNPARASPVQANAWPRTLLTEHAPLPQDLKSSPGAGSWERPPHLL